MYSNSSSLIFYFFTKKIKKHVYISLIIKPLTQNATNSRLIDYQTNKVFQRTIVQKNNFIIISNSTQNIVFSCKSQKTLLLCNHTKSNFLKPLIITP